MACSVVALLLLASAAGPVVFGQRTEDRHAIQARVTKEREQRTRAETWFLHGRIAPGQSAALRYRAHQQKMQMRQERRAIGPKTQASGATQLSGSVWTSLGPAPLASDASGLGQQDYNWVSGRATAVAIDSADSTANTVYLGGAYGGVWKSSNAATANPASVVWTPLIDNQATLAVGAIAIQPQLTNPDPAKSVILVGTGEADSSADSYYGLGILRSADAGTTWKLISSDGTGTRPFAGMAFSKIAFSTTAPGLVVAAAAGASEGIIEGLANPLTANLGLYYSTDGGLSWTYANVQDGATVTAPGSATAVFHNAASGRFFAALRYHGFYSSTDGINWSRLANQPGVGLTKAACPAQSGSSTCPIYRGELAVVPGRNEMYVWYVDANDNDQGIWKTPDGGNTWVAINDSGITNCGDELGCGTQGATYNLELAAVPDGGATDLYAGAVNFYKCQITSASSSCSGTGSNTFLNLTHAYGCSSIARMHPTQHAASFLLLNNNTQDVMYFANDGGVYRALDGYSGLTTGTCGGANQFDSLNPTLGSMTQFVSFAEASSDPNTILGGAQGNGFPATQSALASASWLNVDTGDGGYTAINPQNENEWFVSSPPDSTSGVNIFRCASGINCHTQDFQNDQVVSSATVGGDAGAYHAPFMLDPQNAGEVVVGTCRVWRGSSGGTGFTALSNDFETGGDGICTGGETNLVRSLAAGGPVVNGSSNVIYAGTDGFGPLIPTTPAGGHVWLSANAAGGAGTWNDQTGTINPQAFPISGIATDTSDATGLTAYVSIMGFHVSHVWKTTNGGASWTDFTANLPDAPANAVLVDPPTNSSSGMVYVATDVGVFSSFTASANWTEVGPAPGSGQLGYLPNVAVTALRMLTTGSGKLLRASTYGRGLWQFPVTPSFAPAVDNTPMTVFADQLPAQFGGEVLFYGYTNSVNLSCLPPSQATCSVAPTSVTPSSPSFKVTASGPLEVNAFTVHGEGTDPNQLTGDAPFTLKVVDFNLTAPSVSRITVSPGATSVPVKFQVTAAGPFNQTVTLSCTGLPAGATPTFQPSSSVDPTSSAPVWVTLTIATAPTTTAGTFPVSIKGSVLSMQNAPIRTQTSSLTVPRDYSIAIEHPSLTAIANSTATFNGTLAWLNRDGSGNGYSSPVKLSCGTGAPPTCSAVPTPITPSASGVPFVVTVSSNQCGTYNFDILAQGTDSAAISHSVAVTFSSTSLTSPDYAMEITSTPPPTPVNTPATFEGKLLGTACYNSSINLSCGSGNPPTCKPSPASVTLTPTVSDATFKVEVSSNVAKTYSFSIAGQGTDPLKILRTQLVSFTSTASSSFTFSITNTSGSESIKAGETATYNLTVSPSVGTFPSSVALAFTGCPPISACSLSQTSVAAGKSATTLSFSVRTTAAAVMASGQAAARRMQVVFAVWLWLPGLLFTVCGARRPSGRAKQPALWLSLAVMAVSIIAACGGGLQGGGTASAQPGTPAGTYNMTISATMSAAPGSPTKTTEATLTVN